MHMKTLEKRPICSWSAISPFAMMFPILFISLIKLWLSLFFTSTLSILSAADLMYVGKGYVFPLQFQVKKNSRPSPFIKYFQWTKFKICDESNYPFLPFLSLSFCYLYITCLTMTSHLDVCTSGLLKKYYFEIENGFNLITRKLSLMRDSFIE